MFRMPFRWRIPAILPFALSAAAASQGLDLEGHTGYLMVPSARTMPANSIALSWNHYNNQGDYGSPYTILVGGSAIPWTEIICRYGFPDLSVNGKLGVPIYQTELLGLHAGFGVQDVWGGVRIHHALYGVATARFGWLEGTAGWGNGTSTDIYLDSPKERTFFGTAAPRLEGWFQGASLHIPLPRQWSVQAELLEDMDGNTWRAGGRLGLEYRAWSVDALVATRLDSPEPEFQLGTRMRLPDSASPPPLPSWNIGSPIVLQFGPWMQTFVGTEFGDFDAQAAINSELYAIPCDHLTVGTRVRTRVWQTRNLEAGGPYHSQLQELPIWWESGAIGLHWESETPGSILVQGGWIEGDNIGPSVTLESAAWQGFRLGFRAGYWYSPGWEETRTSAIPALRWDSPHRSWFGQLDAGRYWNKDTSARLRLGRRWGPLSASVGVFRVFDTDETLAEGRVAWSFSGKGFGNEWFQIRPTPEWSHGLRTKLGDPGKELNSLRIGPAKEPGVLLSLSK